MTEHIPYAQHPPTPYAWIDSGQRVFLDNRGFPVAETVWESVHPCCPEHGLMAQGADYWYCEDCDALVREGFVAHAEPGRKLEPGAWKGGAG